jgi:hypothetical protein
MKPPRSSAFIPNLPPLKIPREPAPKKQPKPPKEPRPPPKPKPLPSAENFYALTALHARVKECAQRPQTVPSVQQLLNTHTIEGAFADLRRRVTRRFELWVPDARGELVCINPLVVRGEHLILDPPQRVGERQLLSVDVFTSVYVPAHQRVDVIDGETDIVPASFIQAPKIVWLAKGEVVRLPAPYEYVVVRIVA